MKTFQQFREQSTDDEKMRELRKIIDAQGTPRAYDPATFKQAQKQWIQMKASQSQVRGV